jgi:hypothetical protein
MQVYAPNFGNFSCNQEGWQDDYGYMPDSISGGYEYDLYGYAFADQSLPMGFYTPDVGFTITSLNIYQTDVENGGDYGLDASTHVGQFFNDNNLHELDMSWEVNDDQGDSWVIFEVYLEVEFADEIGTAYTYSFLMEISHPNGDPLTDGCTGGGP